MANRQPLLDWALIPGYDNPRFLNHAQTLALPLLAAGLPMFRDSPRWRRLAWTALIGQMVLLCITAGRATALSIAVATLAALAILQRQAWPQAKALAWSALWGLLAYLLLVRGVPHLMGLTELGPRPETLGLANDHSRLYLWHIALDDIARSPWFGIGPMHFAHEPNRAGAHPHNFYLQLAAEWGIPFALLVTGGLLRLLWRAGQRLRAMGPEASPLQTAAWIACAASLVDGLFSGNFVMPISQMWIALSWGLLLSVFPPPDETPGPLARWVWRGFTGLVALGMAWLLWVSWQEFQAPEPSLTGSQHQMQPGEYFRPRFWRQGWF